MSSVQSPVAVIQVAPNLLTYRSAFCSDSGFTGRPVFVKPRSWRCGHMGFLRSCHKIGSPAQDNAKAFENHTPNCSPILTEQILYMSIYELYAIWTVCGC